MDRFIIKINVEYCGLIPEKNTVEKLIPLVKIPEFCNVDIIGWKFQCNKIQFKAGFRLKFTEIMEHLTELEIFGKEFLKKHRVVDKDGTMFTFVNWSFRPRKPFEKFQNQITMKVPE